MPAEFPTYTANGNISPSRFVNIVSGLDYRVEQCTANKTPVGVSEKWKRLQDATYHAIAGDTAAIVGDGAEARLELGGEVSAGDWLTPDANGRGVAVSSVATATTSNSEGVGGFALRSGTTGEFIPIRVITFSSPLPQV